MGRLEGRAIVVAGGGSGPEGPGNGAATALRIASEGALVVVGDIDGHAAERTARIIAEAGGTAVAHTFDIADPQSTRSLISVAVENFGGLDGIHVNAADMTAAVGPDTDADALTIPAEVWDRTIAANLTGFLYAAQAALPALLERGGGAIVATASDAAFIGEKVRVAYATSKAGLLAVVRHIASRWGRDGITCNSIAPGMIARNGEQEEQLIAAFGPQPRSRRYGRPDDVAALAAFLLSADGEWVNGQVWTLNGGHFLR